MRREITVQKLRDELDAMIALGHGRKPVCIDKATYRHPLEGDGVCILPVSEVSLQFIPTTDGDGFKKWRADGTEAGRMCFVLEGDTTREELNEEAQREYQARMTAAQSSADKQESKS